MKTLNVTVSGTVYSLEMDYEARRVVIYKAERGGLKVWAGVGNLRSGRIEDCGADLGDDVYDALDARIKRETKPRKTESVSEWQRRTGREVRS